MLNISSYFCENVLFSCKKKCKRRDRNLCGSNDSKKSLLCNATCHVTPLHFGQLRLLELVSVPHF